MVAETLEQHEEDAENEEIIPQEEEEEDETDWKAEALKNKELADNQKIRAEKAEAKSKEKKAEAKQESDITVKDAMILMKHGVETEDIDDVVEYAKFKKMSISEALGSSTVKGIIAEKKEQRASASATNTGTAKRGASKTTDDSLLANARKGVMPESDEDLNRLYRLRMGKK